MPQVAVHRVIVNGMVAATDQAKRKLEWRGVLDIYDVICLVYIAPWVPIHIDAIDHLC